MADKIERLGNYALLERLNKGGMAEVYLAKSVGANGVNKFVAIKRILPEHSERKEFIDMFKEEAKIAVNLTHQNVISANEFKIENNQLYMVMDYLQGKNLREILVNKAKKDLKLLIPYIVHVIKEAAAGLDYAHNAVDRTSGMPLNIIHRDMSPQNIMISYQGEIKVIDFGIAKAENNAGESTLAGTLKGKYSYMSPEQADGLPVDKTTDIFALGIILWELLADERLFQANNELNILKRVKECDVPELRKVNPSIPIELDKITKKCLAKEKSFRYASAADLYKDLARFLAREYPEFVPKDFGTFIQGLFSEDFDKMQKKLKEYSKLSMDDSDVIIMRAEPSISLVGVNSPEAPPPFNPKPTSSGPKINETPGSINLNDPGNNVDLNSMGLEQELKANKPFQPLITPESSVVKGTGTGATGTRSRVGANTGIGTGYNTNFNTGISGTSSTVTRGRRKKKRKTPDSSMSINFMLVLIAALIGGYLFLPQKMLNKIMGKKGLIASKDKGGSKATETGTQDLATEGAVAIHIDTQPARANIFLNGTDTGLVSPARVTVPINKPFEVVVSKEGFVTITRRYLARKDASLSLALQSVPVGYLNINIAGVTAGANIFVNGVQLSERPPIKKYAVPANVPTKILVEDKLQNSSIETTVTVGVDQKEDIELNLVPGKNEKIGNTNETGQ